MSSSPVPFEVDHKNNPIPVTLFESYLAKFVLEHPEFYQEHYIQLLTELEAFIATLPEQHRIQREIFGIFTLVIGRYPGYDSFDALKAKFNLSACDFLIKHIGDYFVKKNINLPENANKGDALATSKSSIPAHIFKFYHPDNEERGSPTNYLREQLLFNEQNRGVKSLPIVSRANLIEPYKNLGIVHEDYCPPEFINYFSKPIEPAGRLYIPKEDSYVARYLRKYWCPVIAGASGSTETMFSRIFSIKDLGLSQEAKYLIIFAQACNMIANGHHSLFEAMIVAERFGFPLKNQDTLKEFYLQCVPQVIKDDEHFKLFMESDAIQALDLDTYYATASSECDEKEDEISRTLCASPSP